MNNELFTTDQTWKLSMDGGDSQESSQSPHEDVPGSQRPTAT